MSLARELARLRGGDIRGDHVAIPTPGHSKRDRGTIIRDRADGCGVVVHSFNADWRDVRDALGIPRERARAMNAAERKRLAQTLAKANAEREAKQLARCADLAGEGLPPEPGGPVRSYLSARGVPPATVALAVAAGALREHRDAQGRVSKLALAHDRAGRLRGVQMTKLRPDGSAKRGTDCDRLTFGPYKGSACRLFKVTGDTLAVAEGIETALAFYTLRKLPAWATFGARNLEAFEPPAGVRCVVIAADGDRATKPCEFKGLDAAESLFDRLRKRVRCVIAPAPSDLDWLDVLNAKDAA